ncbi:hypothetical protein ACXZ1K_04055 [Pedobacter sp. PWIIR3]
MEKKSRTVVKPGQIRKYKINECLLKYNLPDHQQAMKKLPKLLNISLNTFHNYRNMLIDAKQDIPHEKVVLFEELFELKRGELLNKVVRITPLKEILRRELD